MSLMTIAHHSSVDLNWQSLLSTIVYAVLGVVLLMVFALLVNRIFRLDLRRELIEDQRTSAWGSPSPVRLWPSPSSSPPPF